MPAVFMAFLLLLTPLDTRAEETVRIVWNNKRIEVAIPLGVERTLEFPNPVNVSIRPADWDAVQITTVGKHSFWKLRHTIDRPIELQAFDRTTGQVYLFQLIVSSQAQIDSRPIRVYAEPPIVEARSQDFKVPSISRPTEHVFETLARFAAQRFYGPPRLRKQVTGIVEVPVLTRATNQLVRGGAYVASPVVQWRLNDHFVTAIVVVNNTSLVREIDFTQLRVDMLAVAGQGRSLLPNGTLQDRTHIYVITDRPFDDTVYREVTWRVRH